MPINHLFQSNLCTQLLQLGNKSFRVLLRHVLLQHHRNRLHHGLTLLQTETKQTAHLLDDLQCTHLSVPTLILSLASYLTSFTLAVFFSFFSSFFTSAGAAAPPAAGAAPAPGVAAMGAATTSGSPSRSYGEGDAPQQTFITFIN